MRIKSIPITIMSLAALFSYSPQVLAAPDFYSIGVAGEAQQRSNWCWAASDVSILDYFGETVTQREVAIAVKGSVVNQGGTDAEAQDGLDNWGVTSTRTASSLSFSSIKNEIYVHERPIYSGWSWNSGGGHAVVIDGYDEGSKNYVEYMDPLDGSHYTETYTWFKGGSSSDHVWDGTLYKMN